MSKITLDGIGHTYHGAGSRIEDYALKPLHHVWEQGKAYALLGPSGCGKTTLLNIISGLITPSRGKLLFGERDVTHLPTEKRNIAQVFQFPVIYDTMTVAGNLGFPLRNRRVPSAQIKARVEEIADLLGLAGILDKRARNLTADVKQTISLGRGLVRSDVSALLLDEPLTVIDPGLKWTLRSKLKQIHRSLDLTMIYVTHDQVEALTFADQVVVMKDGNVLQVATPAELFEKPRHTFVGYFIGSPGMNLLPAEIDGHLAHAGGQVIELGARYARPAPESQVRIGFRPDHASMAPTGGIPVQLRRVEDLGRRQLACAALGPHEIFATIPPGVTLNGDQACLAIEPGRLFVYVNDEYVQGEPL
jgi:glycerol transport system ATP-binding protein